jgi:2-polyprenyl-6-methoxyphenol hydroxylase-like FAD-dependent oxidoreductase
MAQPSRLCGGAAHATIEPDETGDATFARLAAAPMAPGTRRRSSRASATTTQVALVAKLRASPHDGTAFERFTPDGLMAPLPEHDGKGSSDRDPRPGAGIARPRRFRIPGAPRAPFRRAADSRASPTAARFLVMEYAREPARARRVALARAQTLHPVAGQGFNSACATQSSPGLSSTRRASNRR